MSDPAVTICTGPTVEVRRDPDGERWCFTCRTRRQFSFVVLDYTEPTYYDPICGIRCDTCNGWDADLFPGRYRSFDDELGDNP